MVFSFDRQLTQFKALICEAHQKGLLEVEQNYLVFNLAELLHGLGGLRIIPGIEDGHNVANPVDLVQFRYPQPIHKIDFEEVFSYLEDEGLIIIEQCKDYRKFLFACKEPPIRNVPMYGIDEFVRSLNKYIDKKIKIMISFLKLELPEFNISNARNIGFTNIVIKALIEANEIKSKSFDFRLSLHGLYRFLIQRMLLDMGTITGNPIHQSNGGRIDSTIAPFYDNLTRNKVKVGFERDYIQGIYSYLSDVLHGNRSDIDESMLREANETIRGMCNEWKGHLSS